MANYSAVVYAAVFLRGLLTSPFRFFTLFLPSDNIRKFSAIETKQVFFYSASYLSNVETSYKPMPRSYLLLIQLCQREKCVVQEWKQPLTEWTQFDTILNGCSNPGLRNLWPSKGTLDYNSHHP